MTGGSHVQGLRTQPPSLMGAQLDLPETEAVMATRTIKPRHDDDMLGTWESQPERAPSAMHEGAPGAAPLLLFIGFFLTLVGVLALLGPIIAQFTNWSYFIRPGWGYFFLSIGLAMMLAHCYIEPERVFRRMYGMASLLAIASAAAFRFFPGENVYGAYFLPVGVPLLMVGFLFLVAAARRESDAWWSNLYRGVL